METLVRTFVADFETTVYEGQTTTEVWASACAELFTEDVKIFGSIVEQWEYFLSLQSDLIIYFHNLKFDGNFWIWYFLSIKQYKQAYNQLNEYGTDVEWQRNKDMKNNSFKYVISDMGQWYTITVKINNHLIEFRDSLKLLPFSVRRIGNSFKTKHKKLDMEYEGFRYANCPITDKEKEYLTNDILVPKEALEIMFTEGHDKLTIGSCCLDEYKKIMGKYDYQTFYPSMTDFLLDSSVYGYCNADEYIRRSYKGGWCYLVKGKENKIFENGTTADVNSLYPSMMHSESGNRYPVGKPMFWKGNKIPSEAIAPNKYYFVRIKTRFKIKEGYLPFIQIKGNRHYKGTEALETSDIWDKETKSYKQFYYDSEGKLQDTRVTLTLTMTDYELMKEHYDLFDFEIIDGCYFYSEIGLFDEYINKYAELKKNSTGALRELAKLFLNNLYGKMASSTDSSFKVAYLKEDNTVGFITVVANDKKAGYIPVGSAITSYARNFTIRSAQKNYHGVNERGFIYADTDSIHCDLLADEITGIKVHDKNFCCWKLESSWDKGLFVRQKTYIEHVVAENLEPIEKPFYNVKCAGMPERCKELFLKSMEGVKEDDDLSKYKENEKEFIMKKRELTDFKEGLIIPSKLVPKRIVGGVLLVNTTYEMRPL